MKAFLSHIRTSKSDSMEGAPAYVALDAIDEAKRILAETESNGAHTKIQGHGIAMRIAPNTIKAGCSYCSLAEALAAFVAD